MVEYQKLIETHIVELFNKQYRVIDEYIVEVEFRLWRDDNYGADSDGKRNVVKCGFDVIDIQNIRKNGKFLRTVSTQMRMRIIEELEPKYVWCA